MPPPINTQRGNAQRRPAAPPVPPPGAAASNVSPNAGAPASAARGNAAAAEPDNRRAPLRPPGQARSSAMQSRLLLEITPVSARQAPETGTWHAGIEAWVRAAVLSDRTEQSGRERAQREMLARDRMQQQYPPHEGDLNLDRQQLSSLPPMFPAWVTHLSLEGNRLHSVRGRLPSRLESLNVDHNQLRDLPNSLPRGLQTLNANHNPLRSLPHHLPHNLRTLEVNHNQLTALPNTLPRDLRTLEANHNLVTSFPDMLPPHLRTLNLRDNRIVHLPQSAIRAIAGMHPSATVDLRDNPLSPQSVMRLNHLRSQADYPGPHVLYPGIQDAYQAQWQQWATGSLHADEERGEALLQLTTWLQTNLAALQAGQGVGPLHLSWLQLSSLPPLPEGVTELHIDRNRLRELPNNLPRSLVRLSVHNNLLTRLTENLPQGLRQLGAMFNDLTQLPEHLPDNLVELWVQNNQLRQLPQRLPRGLVDLRADGNRLTQLPDEVPDSLQRLEVSHNQLARLPQRLPPSLNFLQAEGNRLTTLADSHLHPVPGGHRTMMLAGNPLSQQTISRLDAHRNDPQYNGAQVHYTRHHPRPRQDVVLRPQPPANAVASGDSTAPADSPAARALRDAAPGQAMEIDDHLQRSERMLAALPPNLAAEVERIRQDAEAAGHPIDADRLMVVAIEQMALGQQMDAALVEVAAAELALLGPSAGVVDDLGQAAAAWEQPLHSDTATTTRLWRSFASEPGATEFAQFLNRLRQTVNVNDPAFQRSVVQWMTQLAGNPTLRRDTFAISIGATESCEDRISLTYNAMRKQSMAADVSRGLYDQRLPDLITLARGVFRLEQLEQIARETTAALVRTHGASQVDEIEVYLGYQVMLREPLALPVETANMAFFRCARLTQDDLDRAQARVLAAEPQEFANYLATDFAPWQEVMQRLAPALHEQAQDTLIDAMGDEFSRRLIDRLRQLGLQGDADAERNLGPVVQAEIAREINGRLTRDFLASQGLLDLLNPDPTHAPDAASPNRSSGRPSS